MTFIVTRHVARVTLHNTLLADSAWVGAFRCHNAAYGRCYAHRIGFPASQHGIFNPLLHQNTDLLFYGVEYFGWITLFILSSC